MYTDGSESPDESSIMPFKGRARIVEVTNNAIRNARKNFLMKDISDPERDVRIRRF